MEMTKIILTVKENMVGLKTVGVNEFKQHTSTNDSSKIAALEAFMILMNSIDTNEKISDTVVHMFLPDVIYMPFTNGSVASYIRCNKTRKGNELSTEEVKAYDKAYDMYLARAKNLVLRTSDFKALDKAKETTVKAEIKECYLKLEKALKKAQAQPQVIVQQAAPQAPVMSESTKRMIDMLNQKAEEALLAGNIDLMERLLKQAGDMELRYSTPVAPAVAPAPVANTTVDTTVAVENTEVTTEATTEVTTEVEETQPLGTALNITIQTGNENLPDGFSAFANAE